LSNEIEKISKLGDDNVWRTSCACMGDDALTFQVCTDKECKDIYLEVWIGCRSVYEVWDTPRWNRRLRTIWRRIKGAFRVLFRGDIEVEGAFIFRGEDQIDAFVQTLQIEKERLKNIKQEKR